MKHKETRLMKIALTSQNRRDLTAHAGRCRHFVVYDTHSPQLPVQWLQLPLAGTLHEADPVADHPLAGIDVLITAGAGDCLRQRLARAGIRLAIATTTSPVNIAALLRKALGENWCDGFAVVEDASTAPNKKPHPQVYQQTLARLGLSASACLAFEDSANGLQAARAAGLPVIITPNGFTAHHDFSGALRVLPSLQGVTLEQLHTWHASHT